MMKRIKIQLFYFNKLQNNWIKVKYNKIFKSCVVRQSFWWITFALNATWCSQLRNKPYDKSYIFLILQKYFSDFQDKVSNGGVFSSKWAISCHFWWKIEDFSPMLEIPILKRTPCRYKSKFGLEKKNWEKSS